MQLDPTLQAIVATLPLEVQTPIDWVALRAQSRLLLPLIVGPAGVTAVKSVESVNMGGADDEPTIRIYRPLQPSTLTLIYVHGGGWTCGELDGADALVRKLCASFPATVVSCTYRLAPEHPFPAAYDDTLAAVRWALAHAGELGGDPQRVVIAGDSAGGNLIAAVALGLRDASRASPVPPGPGLKAQLLLYPAVDLRASARAAASWVNDLDPTLRGKMVDECIKAYLPDHDGDDWRISPLAASDLSGLPPALVVVLSVDPLRDQGLAYAQALEAAGVPAQLLEYPSLTHGFAHLSGIVPAAATALEEVVERFEVLTRPAK